MKAASTQVNSVPSPVRAGASHGEAATGAAEVKPQKEVAEESGVPAAPTPSLPEHLKFVQKLGSGAYGEVFLCDDTLNGSQVAIKWVRDFARDTLFGKRILREIRILAAVEHENLLRLTDLLPVPSPNFDDVYIVMPYMHLDLHKVIYSKMKLSESHAQAFACQILRGLKYLHSAGVCHRDLKPSNILVNKDCKLKIGDLGLARGRTFEEEEELTDYVVTRWYRAPELMLLPSGYFEAVDLWSMGCIHAELLARRPLFPGENHVDMLRGMASALGFSPERDLAWIPSQARDGVLAFTETLRLPECASKPLEERLPNASEVCLSFVHGLLSFDPTKRFSAVSALAHPYVAHLGDPLGETCAPGPFSWDFDRFHATEAALKERVYNECARLHPEILERDAAELRRQRATMVVGAADAGLAPAAEAAAPGPAEAGLAPAVGSAAPGMSAGAAAAARLGPPPARLPRPQPVRVQTVI